MEGEVNYRSWKGRTISRGPISESVWVPGFGWISLLISFSANRLVCRRGGGARVRSWMKFKSPAADLYKVVAAAAAVYKLVAAMLWNARLYYAARAARLLESFSQGRFKYRENWGTTIRSAVVHSLSQNLLRNAKKCRHIFHSFNLHTDAKSRAAHIFGCFRPFLEFV